MKNNKSEEEDKIAFLGLIRGRVQGVGFRYEARCFARSLGLCGWITNLSDGGIETYAEGNISAINRFKRWLTEGPPFAKIESTDFSDRKFSGKYTNFVIE